MQEYSSENNSALLTDLYQLTMMQGYFLSGRKEDAVFDMFFRRPPFGSGYCIFAGLEPFIKTLLNLRFLKEDIEYLKTLGLFQESFLDYLKNFSFKGTIYSVEEGEVVFPNEPLVRVEGNIIELQLIETVLLNTVNFQTLIATKSARMSEAAGKKAVLELGLRRSQGPDGGMSASRASFIGGAKATANVLAGKVFGIPVKGTMAHSWVMAHGSELEAFEKYSEYYPENTILLVDTYNTLEKGIPAAVQALKKLKKKGIKNFGIRIDSGDLEYLSKEARKILDDSDLKETKIYASNDLDETIVEELIRKGSPIDAYGIGTALVTGKGDAALTGVYKLAAKKIGKSVEPCMKVSNNSEKMTNPHIKNTLRFFKDSLMEGDLIILEKEKDTISEMIQNKSKITFCHPYMPFVQFDMAKYDEAQFLYKKIIENGKLVYEFPELKAIQKKTETNLARLHPSYKRLLNPHVYKVSLSEKLLSLKNKMIQEISASPAYTRRSSSD
ncbi:MAG TPA: nicotinate phosphoribosyltransferase [Spirochaetia bacterium]|nr:nicotinate phosphoribosyltransferase [Spirochaetia bacterium]